MVAAPRLGFPGAGSVHGATQSGLEASLVGRMVRVVKEAPAADAKNAEVQARHACMHAVYIISTLHLGMVSDPYSDWNSSHVLTRVLMFAIQSARAVN